MVIKQPGTYLALCSHFCIVVRAIGAEPYIRIPSGVIISDYFQGGSVREVTETSVEIQALLTDSRSFAVISLDGLFDGLGFRDIDKEYIGTTCLEDPEVEQRIIEDIKDVDIKRSGRAIGQVVWSFISEMGMSETQARLAIMALRKKIKCGNLQQKR